MSPLRKGYFTAETQRSQRQVPYCVTPTHALPCIHPWFVFGALCAPGVSAVRFCSEVILSGGLISGANAGAPEVPVTIWNRTFPGRNCVVPGRLESPATPGNRAGGDRRRVRAGDATPPPRSGARARGSSPAPARPLQACGAARPADRSADR